MQILVKRKHLIGAAAVSTLSIIIYSLYNINFHTLIYDREQPRRRPRVHCGGGSPVAVDGVPPYVPVQKVLYDRDNVLYGDVKTSLIDLGLGLTRCNDEDGGTVLWENGVSFRQFLREDNSSNKFFLSEFEPYIPFVPEVFFLGRKDKISEFEKRLASGTTANNEAQGFERKIILWWQNKKAAAPISELRPLRFCPDLPCVLTSNRTFTERSSAMLINNQFIKSPPPTRRPDQVMIYYHIEAPLPHYWYTGSRLNNPAWNHIFNWTMSYRLDADIFAPYGLIRRRNRPPERDYSSIVDRKTGLVAWIVSHVNTQSRRGEYVDELQKYIHVSRYGGGYKKCNIQKDYECFASIGRKYKFYLSFENGYCDDYVTEKLFKYFSLDLIPVVLGTSDVSRHAPRGAYIDVADFPTPKQLAQRMLYLHTHTDQYIKMLKIKDQYFSVYEDYILKPPSRPFNVEYLYESVPFCHICHRIWNLENYTKSIADVREWFQLSHCYPPGNVSGINGFSSTPVPS